MQQPMFRLDTLKRLLLHKGKDGLAAAQWTFDAGHAAPIL